MGKRLTIEELRRRTSEISDAVLISDEYVDWKTKLRFRCRCGEEFSATWNKFSNGQKRCNNCAKVEQYAEKRLSLDEIKRRISARGAEYISGEYVNQKSKLKIRCPKCGEIFERSTNRIFTSTSELLTCTKCSTKRTHEMQMHTIDEVRSICMDKGVELISEDYKNAHQWLKVRCSCGRIFSARLNDITQNNKQRRCRTCVNKESYAEVRIREWLDNNGIKYEQEKRFEECRGKRPYPFDFYLPDQNMCIEFDGEQHFDNRLLFWNPHIQERDAYKSKFCSDHGIKLVRIKYTERHRLEDYLDTLIPR